MNSKNQKFKKCINEKGEEKKINSDPNSQKFINKKYETYLENDDKLICENPKAKSTKKVALIGDSFLQPVPNFFLDTFKNLSYYHVPPNEKGLNKKYMDEKL